MGGVVSRGHDNDDLINNLIHAEYIKTEKVERVFRAVDRADYFLDEARGDAYKDSAWKNGNLHLSAPCIYSEVMEGLQLGPGLSFLNLGSGTGYLSTMVGLILGPYGTNHGIEIHEDVVLYANKKLEEFKKFSAALDEYEFCPPKFVQGNGLCLNCDFPQYDRVYCGASCPESHETYMRNLIKVGGILIMPVNDKLLQIRRVSQASWEETFLLSVSFASLITPSSTCYEMPKILDFEPLTLQEICRSAIRTILRNNIDVEHPDIKKTMQNIPKRPRKKRALRHLVVPIFEESDPESVSDGENRRDLGRIHLSPSSNNGLQFNTFLDLVLGLDTCRNVLEERENRTADVEMEENGEETKQREKTDSGMDQDIDISSCSKNSEIGQDSSNNTLETCSTVDNEVEVKNTSHSKQNKREKVDSGMDQDIDVFSSNNTLETHSAADNEEEVQNAACCSKQNKREKVDSGMDQDIDVSSMETSPVDQSSKISSNKASSSKGKKLYPLQTEIKILNSPKKMISPKNKREKFDSGLGEEITEPKTDSIDYEDDENESSFSPHPYTADDLESAGEIPLSPSNLICKRLSMRHYSDSDSDSDLLDNEVVVNRTAYVSPYTQHMRKKIQALPLPPLLKQYLNLYREF